MTPTTRTQLRLGLAVACLAVAGALYAAADSGSSVAAAQSNFVGGDPTRPDSSDIRAVRLRFEAGARSNWHSHGNWQIIMAEEGEGRTQVRGEPIRILEAGGKPGLRRTRRAPLARRGARPAHDSAHLRQRPDELGRSCQR